MECRNITLTLDKAQEFYNSGNEVLKEIALQAFTEDELKELDFKKFKSWEDIEDDLIDLGLNIRCLTKGQTALLKLNIIRQVLNKGKEMKLTEGDIYYPQIRFATKSSTFYEDDLEDGSKVKVGTIREKCGEEYDVLGNYAFNGKSNTGLGYFHSRNSVGYASADIGFLGCASQKIAEHMSRYFAKEIFDAMYGDFVAYTWK